VSLALYAICERKKRLAKIVWIEVTGLFVAAMESAGSPEPTAENLAAHDAIVRRAGDPALPFRFGTIARDAAHVVELVSPKHDAYAGALARARGCDQMTLRVYGSALPLPPPPKNVGPGARYLHARRAALAIPEIAPLREAVSKYVRAESIERAASGGALLGTVYQLIPRDRLAAWARAVKRTSLPGVRVETSGPWPPYAFCP
jgi:hypothetical protein